METEQKSFEQMQLEQKSFEQMQLEQKSFEHMLLEQTFTHPFTKTQLIEDSEEINRLLVRLNLITHL
jgi:hypothetical protein